jgi:DNA-binding LytR/AlgR family response regulator
MINCVVIDDEQPARELMKLHLSTLPDFHLVGIFDNAVDGFNFLQKNTIDLLFLDIEMPKISGLELIRSLKVCPKVILTTAYREYAVEAFEVEVMDYLVKPITQQRFMKAISRFTYFKDVMAPKVNVTDGFDKAYIFFKVGTSEIKVYLKDILYIEALKDFIKVHTLTKTFVASERLSYMEEKLPERKFARAHKSFIVALDKITSVHADKIMIGNISIPVGRVFKNELLKKIQDNAPVIK